MGLHKVEYTIPLTGSKLFDMVMHSTAENLCDTFPSLSHEYVNDTIRVFGELDDTSYEKYQEIMFNKE